MKRVIWTLTDLKEIIEKRRQNEFDCNLLITGTTGKGKSSLGFKFLSRFDGFNIRRHLTYDREETIKLLRDQKFSFCWNDELIAAGYKREHWNNLQIQLIKILTQYRCNWNTFVAMLPVFFTCDKELLKLFAMNIDVIKRGEGILHMRRQGRRYTDDPWDTKYNQKLEENWSKMIKKNPNFKIPYHKYSTYVGHLYWNDITPKQRELYEKLRDEKKAEIAERMDKKEEVDKPFYEQVFELMIEGKLDENGFDNICRVSNRKMTTVRSYMNKMLKEKKVERRVSDFLKPRFIIKKKKEEESFDEELERVLNAAVN